MSIEAIVNRVLESGQINQDQEEWLNLMLHEQAYTDADLCALDTLCVALFTGKVQSVTGSGQASHAA